MTASATESVSNRTPTFSTLTHDVLSLQSQVRMLKSYAYEHIDESTDGPNEGNAGPDIMFQCEAMIKALDKIFHDLDILECSKTRKRVAPANGAEHSLQ